MPVNDLIQLRKGTDSVWSSINPVLSSGEPGYDSTFNILKVGDGTSTWSNLNPVNLSGTYFNNAVSGLLPVKNIVAGSDISVSSISGIYTISNTMTSVETSASVVTTVFNKTGASIPKMTAVYINGGQGDLPTIQKALATADISSAGTYGITYEAIDNMSSGRVIVLGALTGLNTDQFNPTAPQGDVNGSVLYLSPTVSGALTTTKPYAPYHIVAMGTIVRTHQNEGVIEVRVQNGYELEELHNVAVTGATNGQFLQYNSTSGLWVPSSSGNFTTLQVNNTGVSLNGHSHTSSNITDWNEAVDDRVSSLLVAGSGINLNYNDSNNTLTVNLSVVAVTGYEILNTNKSSFTVSQGYISNNLNVYLNGSKLVLGQDYTASDGSTFDLVQTASSGDVVEWQGIGTPAIIESTIDGNGTSNYLTKWVDSNTLTTGIIYDNGTNIGIGTSSPTFKLDVVGSGAFTGNVSVSGKITHPALTGTNDFIIYSQGDDTLISAKAGNNVRIRAGGNDSSYETIISSSYMYIGGDRIRLNSAETIINEFGSNYDFRVEGDNDQNLLFLDASTDRFGVGTNSPSYKLDVIGTGNFSQNLLVNGTGVSLSGHTHSSSQITDFNSSVSGLLPVKNIVAGSGISLSISDGAYTINSSGTSNLNTEDVMDIMGTGLIAGTGISVVYNDTNGTITVSLAATTITGYEILTTTKDTFTVTPNYLIGNLNVYYNGFKLLNNEDYTATDGSTFVLNAPGASGDVVEWIGLGEPGQYASLNHTHTISDITNFGSGVSGLLPTIANSGNNRVLTSTGSSTGINAESNFTFDGTSLSHHAGNFANAGDAQHTILVARRTTTDSTADVVLTLDGNTPGASNRPTIPSQSVWTFSLKLSAYNDTDSLGAWWIIRGGIRRNGANGTALVGSLVVENDSEGAMSGTSATVVADDTNEALEIRVTGLSSKNIRWVGVLDISQVSYGTP